MMMTTVISWLMPSKSHQYRPNSTPPSRHRLIPNPTWTQLIHFDSQLPRTSVPRYPHLW
jgi:hypothetical protein